MTISTCLVAQTTTDTTVQLTTGGAAIMAGSIVLVCGLCLFCLLRILRGESDSSG